VTQKERILTELIQNSNGLTAVELEHRTGMPEPSLRTNLWAMRKDGWIEPVSGVRGRYRYGVTPEGRRQAPAQLVDAIAETIRRRLGVLAGTLGQEVAVSSEPRRQLLDFVRWLAQEHRDLLVADDPDIVLKLEEAAADFLYRSGHADAINLLLGPSGFGRWSDDR
jgi:hypothetical protein